MRKSIFTAEYDRLRQLLIESRKAAGFSQQSMAACLGRPQSFVSKYERGERRLDVVELLQVAKCLKIDGPELVRRITSPAERAARDGHANHDGHGAVRRDGTHDGPVKRPTPDGAGNGDGLAAKPRPKAKSESSASKPTRNGQARRKK